MRERSGGRRAFFVLILIALVGVVTAAGIFPFRQIIADRRSVALAEEKLSALRAENERLEAEVVVLGTDDEVERLARERFGLVRPGEIAYAVVTPETDEAAEAEPEPTLADPGEKPWWRDLWDFLTGGDLVRDG